MKDGHTHTKNEGGKNASKKKMVEMKRKEGQRRGSLEGAGRGGGTKTKMTKEINKNEETGLVTF